MINVAGFGHANNRVDQQVGLGFAGGAEGQLLVGAVQRVAGLEGDNFAPADFAEIGAQFIWGVAAGAEIIVHRLLDAGDRAAQIDAASLVVQVVDGRMRVIVGAKDHFGLAGLVWRPAVGDGHGGEDHAFLVAQGDVFAHFQGFGKLFGDIQVDRHRPERPIGQPHVFHNAVVVFLGQEALERVEAAIHQKLKIADLARCQVVAFQLACVDFQLLSRVIRDIELGDRSQIVLHWMSPVFNGRQAAGGAREFRIKRVVFSELAGEELIGEATFLGGASPGQCVGIALPLVRAGAVADCDQPGIRSRAQLGVQPAQGHTQSRSRRALRGLRCQVQLAQESEEQVFFIWGRI